jgi:hypothetical protein
VGVEVAFAAGAAVGLAVAAVVGVQVRVAVAVAVDVGVSVGVALGGGAMGCGDSARVASSRPARVVISGSATDARPLLSRVATATGSPVAKRTMVAPGVP